MFRLNQKQWKLSVILFSSHAVSPGGESLAVPKLLETYLCIHTQIYHMCVTAKRKERRKAEEKSRKGTRKEGEHLDKFIIWILVETVVSWLRGYVWHNGTESSTDSARYLNWRLSLSVAIQPNVFNALDVDRLGTKCVITTHLLGPREYQLLPSNCAFVTM